MPASDPSQPSTPLLRLLQAMRWLVLAAAVAGVFLHQDADAADSLAPKIFWFGLAGGLLPALAALRLWWGGTLHLPPAKVTGVVVVWALAVTAAYLGSPLRLAAQAGWQACLLSGLLLLSAVDLLADDASRRWLLRCLTLAAGLAGLWSVAQRLGLDASAVGRMEQAAFGSRVAGTFGNPNFAGGAFALVLPVLAHQALAAETRSWRWAARAAAGVALLGLLFSGSKAAALGLLASLAVGAHLLFWSRADMALRRRVLRWAVLATAAALLAGVVLTPRDTLARLFGGPAAWGESVAFRQVTWAGTVDMVRARPATGWGPGTFSVAYPSYRRPEAMAVQSQHNYEVTHPENWVLQMAAETGALGLLATLALLGVLLLPLRGLARDWSTDPARSGLALALLAAVAGCLTTNLASLDVFLPSTLLPLILLLGLGVALSAERAPAAALNPETYAKLLVSAGLALMASVPVAQAQLRWQGSRLLAQARALSQAGAFDQAIPLYRLAVDMDPALLEARYFLGCSLQDRAQGDDLAAAETVFQDLRAWAPDYVLVHERLGRLYQSLGRAPEAAQAYEYQLKLDPWDLRAVQALASLYASQGRLAEAEAVLTEAAMRWPSDGGIAANLSAVQAARLRLIKRKR